MDWLRLWHDARTDRKLEALTDAEHRVWFSLLIFASEQPERGVIAGKSMPLLAVEVAKGDEELLRGTLDRLVLLEMVETIHGNVVFLHWEARQRASDDAAKRQRAYRESRDSNGAVSDMSRDTHATLTNCPVLDTDTERDTERDTETGPQQETLVAIDTSAPSARISSTSPAKAIDPRYSSNFDAFWPVYPRHRDKAPAFKAYQTLLKRGATPDQLLAAAGHFAEYVEMTGTEEEHVPYAATWMNEGKWLDFRDGVPSPPARRNLAVNGRPGKPSFVDQIDLAVARISGATT